MDEDTKTWQWTKEFLQMIGPESLGRSGSVETWRKGWKKDNPDISRFNFGCFPLFLEAFSHFFQTKPYPIVLLFTYIYMYGLTTLLNDEPRGCFGQLTVGSWSRGTSWVWPLVTN
jgi:hypothetical protein